MMIINIQVLSVLILTIVGLSLCQTDSAESLHPQDHRRHHRQNTEAVFWQKIGDQIWSADYGNPCQSGPGDYDGETLDPAAMVSSLNIADREDTLRAKAGNLLSKLRHLERFVVSS
jgi:hypothetical protein